jgi:hypothetical protein
VRLLLVYEIIMDSPSISSSQSPIALFTYARPEHTKRTIEALQANAGATESELFIFSDAAKNPTATIAVAQVRSYLRTITGFKRIEIIERPTNLGLADSIVDGVSTLVGRYGRAIVLEDDIVTAPSFLSFMNQALTLYEHDQAVMHVSGYFYPLTDLEATTVPETFFYNQTSCWGWGTWQRAWKHYQADAGALLAEIKRSGQLRTFDMDNRFRFSSTLRANAEGRQHTWAIKWHASVFLRYGLCLHPRYSLTHNIGHDGSGTHGQLDQRYDDPHFPPPNAVIIERGELVESTAARALATTFLERLKPPIWKRAITFLRRLFP